MDAVTEKIMKDQPAKQSTPKAQDDTRVEELTGPKVTTKNVTLRVALIEREDGIFECGITTKSGEIAEITYGATKSEAVRRGLKKNAARIGRNLRV